MAKTRLSITSTLVGRQLLELISASMPQIDDEPPAPVTLERSGYAGRNESWSVRFSAVWGSGQHGSRLYATGGIVLKLTLQAPSWNTWRPDSWETRLKPGWTEHQLKLAVARGDLWARRTYERIIATEPLDRLQERVTTEDIEVLEQIERETGRSMVFGVMSAEDANFWLALLKARHPEWEVPA
jgi:hypothetical protein